MKGKNNEKNIVLYLAGGAMTGVFGAGVVAALQDADAYQKIEAVYATSAGALNGAYFLTKQVDTTSSLYWEEMTDGVIDTTNFLAALTDRVIHRFIFPLAQSFVSNVIDINKVIDIVRNERPLNSEKLSRQSIPFYVKLLNVQTGAIEYKQLNSKSPEEIFNILKAAVSIIPYYFPPQKIGGNYYADGGVAEPIGIDAIRKNHPKSTIVTVVNMRYRFGYYIEKFFEALVADFALRGVPLFTTIMRAITSVRVDLKTIQNNDSILFVSPPKNSPTLPYTTTPEKLKKTYWLGMQEAQKILRAIEN